MDIEALIVWVVGIGLTALVAWPFVRRQRRLEREAAEAEVTALRYGLHEPASLHPIVDLEQCIGTGNCVTVCPEKDVLGLRSGQAHPVSPARCVGHGLCERSCPMDAIQLVFGTEKRGVDIPRIKENFETNVPGIYIIGELGGMGLIRNAFEQGRQCIDGIAAEGREPLESRESVEGRDPVENVLDVLIVGCGPAGLSASLHCIHHGLRFVTIEKEDLGGTVRTYPRKKLVMTAPLKVPGYGRLRFREIPKEELVAIWEDVAEKTGLEVQTGETVTAVTTLDDGTFRVESTRGSYRARRVVLAIGRRGVPRKLGVPGEDAPKVAYALREPDAYQSDRILVVGGGDAAVEAALALADQPDNEVAISYRRRSFSRLKPQNLERIEAATSAGTVDVLWGTNITEISPTSVTLVDDDGRSSSRTNDYVFIFAGGELPTSFLKSCGVRIETKFGRP